MHQIRNTPPREPLLCDIHKLLDDNIIIGHSIEGDLKAINYSSDNVYDISRCPHIRQNLISHHVIEPLELRKVSLKQMAMGVIGIAIQSQHHTAMEDAIATMQIFNCVADEFVTSPQPPSPIG